MSLLTDRLMLASKYEKLKTTLPTLTLSLPTPSPHQLTVFAAVGSPEAWSRLFRHIPSSHSFSGRHLILALGLMESSNSQHLSPEVPGG